MNTEIAVFAGGCFWCLEAVFQQVQGVEKVVSGYTGGQIVSPSYDLVSSWSTGHAEAVQIEFDPGVVSYQTLLDIFFTIHDPTTLNQQGNDLGTQYRSGIYFVNATQQQQAADTVKALEASGEFSGSIVTELQPLDVFYPAEEYHQNYFQANKQQPYCQLVISPKIKKFHEKFKDLLKQEHH